MPFRTTNARKFFEKTRLSLFRSGFFERLMMWSFLKQIWFLKRWKMVNSNPVLGSKILSTFPFPIFLKSSFLTIIIMRFFSGVKPFNEGFWNQILNSSTSMNTRICGPTKIFLTRVKLPISNMRGILRIFHAMWAIISYQRYARALLEK